MIWIIVILPARHIVIDIIYFMARVDQCLKYGFVIPIAYYLHENYPDSVHQNPNKGIDLELKQMAQKYLRNITGQGKSLERFSGKADCNLLT